ncbi:MAG: cellobiose phosphorylase, partial [Brevefilum sp.]
NFSLGYQINSLFFTLSHEPFSGLVRQVSIKNLGNSPLQLEILDGLPGIVPYGVENGALKHVSRTIEAWMQVDNLEESLPFFRLKATPGDTAAVHTIESGNYAMAFNADGMLSPIVDPKVVFGHDTSQADAHLFYEQGLDGLRDQKQILEGRTPSAFFAGKLSIPPGQSKAITSVYGYAADLSNVNASSQSFQKPGYISKKLYEARELTENLTDDIRTSSYAPNFDGYCRLTFLDNLLRGGYPILLGDEQHITHVYSRKHGDIERDYNYFVIPPEYYSQGNGNYRDVNQNRRNDPFFLPQAGEFNIRLFMSLIQADGYNPLVINGLSFTVPQDRLDGLLALVDHDAEVKELLAGKFTPGQLLHVLEKMDFSEKSEEFFQIVFSSAQSHIEAEHGEGYWVDHWTYNLDLIESYLSIFPDKKSDLLFTGLQLPFYDNAHIVQPRKERFVEHRGKPIQLNAVVLDAEKEALIKSRGEDANWARMDHGKGEIFRLPLISKLSLLALIKFATLDPSGMGVMMEAGRPGWYDALNGLPGMFGSSMPETYELVRLVEFLSETLQENPQKVTLPLEAQILLDMLNDLSETASESFPLWERRMTALERYREAIRLGFDGSVFSVELNFYLDVIREILAAGIRQAHTFKGDVPPTYFVHKVKDYRLKDTKDPNGNPYIEIKDFKPEALPAFLEGPVRMMKISEKSQARNLARSVRKSDLFDEALGMYKVNTSLESQPHEIGRARAFTPGWLENESIWLHMSFKYLLELLKAGLFDEYFEALETHLPAFMDPDVYGRSPLENSSFIVSSVHPDSAYHGRGFVARLSGSTAEFLSMWVLMTVGRQPFKFEGDHLTLEFNPSLPAWLFKEDGTFMFRFLGACDVTIHNPTGKSTYEKETFIKKIWLQSTEGQIEIDGAEIDDPMAQRVRSGEIDSIDLFYDLMKEIGE